MFPRKCVDYETCSCACYVRVRALRDGCVHTFWLTKTCLCVTFNIWHHVCHQISHKRSRNDVQPHDLIYEPFSLCNFSHMKSCLRTLVWPMRRTVMRARCEKTSLYATFWLTWTFPHANFNLLYNFLCLCSTNTFPRSVSFTRRVHAHVHTKRRVSAHFLTYEVMFMRNFYHMTPCLSHNFPQVQSKQSTTSRLFNLGTLLTMQLLTYKDVSVRKLSHKWRVCV